MKLKLFALLTIGSILFLGCEDKVLPVKPIDPAFTNYIQAFTAGVISNQSKIRIQLTEANSNAEKGKELEEDLFDFSPDVEGKAVWLDERTIEFIPKERLPSGVLFQVAFDLDEIQDVPKNLEVFEFRFQVIRQTLNVAFEGMKAYNDEVLKWQQLRGSVQTADFAELAEIEKAVYATQDGKELDLSWEFDSEGFSHVFYVDSVSRKETEEKVVISWDGEGIGSEVSGEEVVVIPALGDFKVMNITTQQLPNQLITINFSDPIHPNQNLNGLIYSKEGDDFRITKGRNSVLLYPANDISGSRNMVVTKSLKNSVGYALQQEHQEKITFTSMKPEVEIIGSGNILPSSGGFKLPIRAVNLSGVNVKVLKIFESNISQFFQNNQYNGTRNLKQVGRLIYKDAISLIGNNINLAGWNNFELDLTKMVEVEPGAIYRVTVGFDRSQSLYPCQEKEEFNVPEYKLTDADEAAYDSPNGYYYDYYDDYYYNDDYNYQEKGNPCKSSYYYGSRNEKSQNILASDLGIIAKSGDNNALRIVVTDLKTTNPLSGVAIDVLNYQQQVLASWNTNELGIADIPLDGKPFLIVAKREDERGYLRIDDGSALSLSMFDISGEKNIKGLKGFIYGERGVWRPGDSLFLNFILEDKNNSLPENHPVVFELYTPDNQLFIRKVKNKGVNKFYNFNIQTNKSSPTGNWQAKVKVGNSTFYKQIKIEAIKPNRLKIKIDFEEEILTKGNTNGKLSAKWLHGADAGNLRAKVEMNLSSGNTNFKDYPEFKFDDPVKDFSTEEKVVYDNTLNEVGETQFNPAIEVGSGAPGMLQAFFKTRVFEKGGDFSVDRYKVTYSPYESYVGVKIPKGNGWNDALYSNENNLFPIVTVDEKGELIDRENLKVEVFDVYWRWWWERGNGDDLAKYVNNRSRNLIKSETINTKNGKALFSLKFEKNRYGRKLIRITDPVSGHVTGATFYMTYRGWWNSSGGNNPGGAEMLSFATDKKKYNVGETVQLKLPEIKEGKVLVSLESGSKIIETFWKDASEIKEGISIETTEEMAPNVYAHLTLIQPHATTKNDLPIRLYGVQNISVEAPNTHLNPTLEMPKELAPEEKFTVKVAEREGKKMTYTIAIVDEGLLDLTRFKTPNPWSIFYKKEALGIKTWDLYKYVMGAFAGEISGLLAIGGDGSLEAGEGNKANRFKPVVMVKGPFTLEKGKVKTHSFNMPNYVGSVRAMVVAGNNGAYGAAEETVAVKKPLMVLATLPRVVSPAEKIKLPVTVFAMDEKISKVKVSVIANENFIVTEKMKNISFDKIGDQIVYFDLEVKEKIGIGKIKVLVEGAGENASNEIEIGIRLPNPEIDKTISAIVEPGKSWSTNYSPIGIEGTNKGAIEVSSIPPLNLEKRLNYLIRYPHGCIEQTTSAVFPQLYLSDLLNLSSQQKQEIQANITEALNKLRLFQLNSGGFAYWSGNLEVSDWGTNYAGHFMLEAKRKGYAIPDGMLESWRKYQTKTANFWEKPRSTYESRYYRQGQELSQAYRLYTLALAGKPSVGAMNRLREENTLYELTKWRLAAAYALTGKKAIAKDIVANLKTSVENYQSSYTYGSSTRDEAMILETLDLLGEKVLGKEVLDRIAQELKSNRWMSTQTTAYSLMAIANFVQGVGDDKTMRYNLSIHGENQSITTEKYISKSNLIMKEGKVEIKNAGDKTLFIQLNLSGVPLVGENVDKSNRLSMNVRYLNMANEPISVDELVQGTDFMAEVTVIHPGGAERQYNELALNQIFPSGWEIRNLRMDETNSKIIKDKPEYEDIRDDRVYTYFDLQKGKQKKFRVLLNAAYLGKYYLPAIECSAMYNNNIQAVKSGKWVEVVEIWK